VAPIAKAKAARTLRIAVRVRGPGSRRSVRISGTLSSGAASCRSGQRIIVERRLARGTRFRTIARPRTNSRGEFSAVTVTRSSVVYRAKVAESSTCRAAVSASKTVAIVVPRLR